MLVGTDGGQDRHGCGIEETEQDPLKMINTFKPFDAMLFSAILMSASVLLEYNVRVTGNHFRPLPRRNDSLAHVHKEMTLKGLNQ